MTERFEMNELSLVTYLGNRGLKFRKMGKEIVLDECPYCKSKDKKFSFDAASTKFQCFKAKCGVKGNLLEFMRAQGDDPIPKKKAYALPDQTKVRALKPVEKTKADRFYAGYGGLTGLSAGILQKYDIGYLWAAPHNAGEAKRLMVTFPYINEDGEIFDVKYRNKDVKSDMWTEKAAKKNFFGLQFVDFAKEELLVTEGEKDTLALADMGFENVVSVPMGARNFTEPMMETIRKGKFRRIYLFFDNDEAGQQGARDFAIRIGNWRCRNVRLPYKDAQECLQNWVEAEAIRELMTAAKKFDIEDTLENDVLLSPDEQRDRFEADCRANQYGIKFRVPLLDAVTGGLFPGQTLGILAGPGGFKTMTLQNLLHKASDDLAEDEFAAFFSMDMNAVREFQRRIQMELGWTRTLLRRHAAEGADAYTQRVTEYCKKRGNIYVSDRSNLTVSQMVQVIRNTEYMTGKRCRLVAIDYLDYIEHEDNKAYNPVGQTMNAINKKLAKPMGVSVILLVQTNRPHLTEGEYGVSIGDGKGGRSIEQELDFYFGLFTDKDANELRGNWLKHRDFEPDRALFPEIYPFPFFRVKMERMKLVDMELITKDDLAYEKAERKKKKSKAKGDTTW